MRRALIPRVLLVLLVAGCDKNTSSSASPSASPADAIPTPEGDIQVTPLHHATFVLQFRGKALYFDPVKDAKYDGLPKADLILVTHTHPDHFDPEALEKVRQPTTAVVVPPAVAEKAPAGWNVVILKNGESRTVNGVGVEAVAMYNLKRGPASGGLFHEKGVGDGFVVTLGGKRIYVSGDTECTPEMRALPNIDVAFVCMNLPYTMPPSEAAECVNAFRPKVVYPYHDKGSDPAEFQKAVTPGSGVEVRIRDWYR